MLLDKSPTQEEFIRGQLTNNPYNSAEVGPLMRDVKNFICRELDMEGDQSVLSNCLVLCRASQQRICNCSQGNCLACRAGAQNAVATSFVVRCAAVHSIILAVHLQAFCTLQRT